MGLPDFDLVIVVVRVNGLVVALPEIDLVTLPLRVNGLVVGIPDRLRVNG